MHGRTHLARADDTSSPDSVCNAHGRRVKQQGRVTAFKKAVFKLEGRGKGGNGDPSRYPIRTCDIKPDSSED